MTGPAVQNRYPWLFDPAHPQPDVEVMTSLELAGELGVCMHYAAYHRDMSMGIGVANGDAYAQHAYLWMRRGIRVQALQDQSVDGAA